MQVAFLLACLTTCSTCRVWLRVRPSQGASSQPDHCSAVGPAFVLPLTDELGLTRHVFTAGTPVELKPWASEFLPGLQAMAAFWTCQLVVPYGRTYALSSAP